MELLTIAADEVLQIAQRFRARAAEGGDAVYQQLMLRTAKDLEDHAATLAKQGGSKIAPIDPRDEIAAA